ncbi:paramyosin-like [Tigriopus californicus]|uniref:paramyosin-like n=1 Tax=Tigriopus californicus TaxID=6832 RepID=UPI0027DA4CE7|nr:paramyosin-like [Tigriopus californicus]
MGHLIQLKIQELETKKEEKNDVEQTLVKMTGTLASYIQAAEAQVEMKAKLLDQKAALEDTLKQVSDAVQDMQSRVDEIKSNIKTSRSQINERKEHCETQMHEKGEKMNALQIQWDNAEAEKNALETTLEEKKKILAEGHDELKKLHHTYEKLRATSTEASKTIDEELRKVSEKQERLGQDIEAAKGQNQVAQEKVSSLTQENTGLELKLQTRSDEIRALQQEIDRLTNYYNELPGARKDLELAQFDIQSLRSVQARSFGLEKENKILKEKKRQLETDLQAMEAQFNANNDDEHEFNHTLLEMKTIEEEWNRKSRELKEKQAQRTLALDLKKVLETKNEELNNLREEQTRKYNQQVNQIKTSTDQTIAKKDKLEKVLEKLSNDLNRVQNQDDVAKTKDPLGTADEDTPRPTHPRLKKTLTSDSNSSASSDWLSSFQKSRESKALPTKGSLSTLFDSASDSQ